MQRKPQAIASTEVPVKTVPGDEAQYHAFLESMQDAFDLFANGKPLFTVDTPGDKLWERYLGAISEEHRQHSNCHACRRFVEQYGNVVTIDSDGELVSPIWSPGYIAPEAAAAVRVVRELVENARVNGVFLSSEKQWGTPQTGSWRHLAVTPPAAQIYRAGVLNAHQKMAELREDYRCLQTALIEFKPEVLAQARTILEADALARSEKFLGVVTWLQERQAEWKLKDARLRTNLLWRAVATAPAGFCKPRASMVGTLLEDLLSGMAFADVKRRFDAKMHPLAYQRPQAPPSAGNIAQAEATIAKLGLVPSLYRRFATLEDVQAWVWQPRERKHPQGESDRESVFGHLKPKGAMTPTELALPKKTLTWIKFRDTVLPSAEKIELYVPSLNGSFAAFVTAVDPEAPPLLQWDREDARNPVSWYFYAHGSPASQWSLKPGWTPVSGLTLKPNMWNTGFDYQGAAVMCVLEGARDTRNSSLGLFPEILRSELHGVRATIEAHSRSRKLDVMEGAALASGLMFTKGSDTWNDFLVRVTTEGHTATYQIDRWD